MSMVPRNCGIDEKLMSEILLSIRPLNNVMRLSLKFDSKTGIAFN